MITQNVELHKRILSRVLRAEAWRRERIANYFRFAILTVVGLAEWHGRSQPHHAHLTAMPFVLLGWGVTIGVLNVTLMRRHFRRWFPAVITTLDILAITLAIRIVFRHAVDFGEESTREIERAFLGLFVVLSANAIRFSWRTTLWSGLCAILSMWYLRVYSGTLGSTAIGTDLLAIGGFVAILMYANRTVRAVTERLLVDLRQAQERRLSSLRALVAGVMHEMNSPLGAIESSAELTGRAAGNLAGALGEQTPDKVARALGALEESSASTRTAVSRLSAVVETLREFARVDDADFGSVDVRKSLDTCLELLADDMGGQIEVQSRLDDLPAVFGNAAQINQALMHVLRNAVESIDGDGRIAIEGTRDGDDAVIRISDTGRGIAPEKLDRIFNVQLSSRGSRVALGLGLPIAHSIVQDHGGSIDIESKVGAGTSVTLRLPVR